MRDYTKKKNIFLAGFVCVMVVVCQLGAATATQSVETTYDFNNPYFLVSSFLECK